MGMVQRAIRGSTDSVVAFAVRRFLNARLAAIGEVTDATLDTAQQRVQLRLALHGEPEAIDVEVGHYRLEQTARGAWLTVTDAVASRPWVTAALQGFVIGRRFHIRQPAATILQIVA